MATLSAIKNEPASHASAAKVDMKFEVVVIPVTDVDRSKAFYSKLGWRLDADFPFDNGFRVVQFTPPGSGCSVQFGTKMTTASSFISTRSAFGPPAGSLIALKVAIFFSCLFP